MERGFVFLDEVLSGVRWDAKYATWDNFTGTPVDGYEVNRIVGSHALEDALLAAKTQAQRQQDLTVLKARQDGIAKRLDDIARTQSDRVAIDRLKKLISDMNGKLTALDGIEVEYVRFVAPPRSRTYASWFRWAERPLARALARGPGFDLVHAHYAHLAGAAALRYTQPRDIPLVVSVHGDR